MSSKTERAQPRYRAIQGANVERTAQWKRLAPDIQEAVRVVSKVLPFRTNAYVMKELIRWENAPDDPIFQLTFPQRGMLTEQEFDRVARLLRKDAPEEEVEHEANKIRFDLNPHPAGQQTENVPTWHGEEMPGTQHKYRETVLFFPSQGQTCHAFCTFCFRWAQFVGIDELKFASNEVEQLVGYLEEHKEVTDVLFTGGDPMIMSADALRRYVEPLLGRELEHVQNIRIGTKAVAYWPQRFVTDRDADDLLRLFKRIVRRGRHLAVMGHYSHPVELSTEVSRRAIERIRSTGAEVRMQSPVVRHVNDDADVWMELWKTGVRLGCVPYYMFVERDTGARDYFDLPLVRCWEIFRDAYNRVSGLGRTVRGPSMSARSGKVHILGVTDYGTQDVFVLQYLQARDPALVRRPFFAKFDPEVTWFSQLEPATKEDCEFFPHIDEVAVKPSDLLPAESTWF
jgi:KamA family protein